MRYPLRRLHRNYLRVRGEYRPRHPARLLAGELPPRARRILSQHSLRLARKGTTSACAENTRFFQSGAWLPWNYLRVRGEYLLWRQGTDNEKELPPRARRIHPQAKAKWEKQGTTSACAENTFARLTCRLSLRDYLRVRGEYSGRAILRVLGGELPPRARRIRKFGQENFRAVGTTSACAENTRGSR